MFRRFIAAVIAAVALNAFAAVDVNRADRAELETVKGVGPGLSAKILKAREAGEFKDWSDMVTRVPGIGTASAGKLSQAGLTVGGAAFDASQIPASTKPARQRKAAGATGARGAQGSDGATGGGETSAKPARKAARKDAAAS